MINIHLTILPIFVKTSTFAKVFSLFRYYLTLEKGEALHLNKLESSSLKDALCQVLLKLAQWFWRRIFFKFRKLIYFHSFVIISPWKRACSFKVVQIICTTLKDHALNIYQLHVPCTLTKISCMSKKLSRMLN